MSAQSQGTATRAGTMGQLGRGSVVIAVFMVQIIVFAATYAAGRTTLYLLFAVVSAAVLGYASNEGWFAIAAAALGTILLIAVGFPLMMFVAGQNPALIWEKLLSTAVHQMLYLSIYAPLLAALFTLVFGVPLAYLLTRGFPGQEIIESLVDLPLVVPHSVAGLLILFSFGGGDAFPQLTILGTITGLVLAMVFVSAPFAVNIAREGFESIDESIEYAARIHGANRWETFRRVTLPLSARSVLTGGVLAWARSVSEFGAVAVIAYNVSFFYPFAGEEVISQHAPVFIYETYLSGSLAESSAVGFILLALSIGIFLLVRWLAYDDSSTASAMP